MRILTSWDGSASWTASRRSSALTTRTDCRAIGRRQLPGFADLPTVSFVCCGWKGKKDFNYWIGIFHRNSSNRRTVGGEISVTNSNRHWRRKFSQTKKFPRGRKIFSFTSRGGIFMGENQLKLIHHMIPREGIIVNPRGITWSAHSREFINRKKSKTFWLLFSWRKGRFRSEKDLRLFWFSWRASKASWTQILCPHTQLRDIFSRRSSRKKRKTGERRLRIARKLPVVDFRECFIHWRRHRHQSQPASREIIFNRLSPCSFNYRWRLRRLFFRWKQRKIAIKTSLGWRARSFTSKQQGKEQVGTLKWYFDGAGPNVHQATGASPNHLDLISDFSRSHRPRNKFSCATKENSSRDN